MHPNVWIRRTLALEPELHISLLSILIQDEDERVYLTAQAQLDKRGLTPLDPSLPIPRPRYRWALFPRRRTR